MATMTHDTTNQVWVFTDTLTSSSYNVVFDTLNKFTDAKIKAALTVQSGTINKPFITNTNLGTYFEAGTSSSNSISLIPKVTNSGGFISEHNSSSPVTGDTAYYTIIGGTLGTNTADVVLYNTDGSNAGTNIKEIVGAVVDTEPNTDSYYLAFTGSGNSKVTKTGWIAKNTTATATTKTRYFPIRAAAGTVTKTSGSITPTASLSQSNVTFSNSNTSGVSVTATGNGSATFVAQMNVSTSGYVPAGNNLWNSGLLSIAAASTAATDTQYITGVTIGSGKSFAVTNSGTTTVTSGSTSAGKVTIVAKNAASDSSNTTKDVVVNGLWNPQKMAAANTSYYGRVYADALTVTTSSTNTNMGTYFDSLNSSSGASVTITPKYTNTAGFKTALSTATNNGGTTYWKIKTTSVTQNNTTVNTTGSDNLPTAVTRGKATWGTGWITGSEIGAALFRNAPTSGVTYIDISKTDEAPILTVLDNNGGGYLYINKGYTDNLKISLARLIPDSLVGENISFAPANYILTGYAAFNAAGVQITGTMQKYNGEYTVS